MTVGWASAESTSATAARPTGVWLAAARPTGVWLAAATAARHGCTVLRLREMTCRCTSWPASALASGARTPDATAFRVPALMARDFACAGYASLSFGQAGHQVTYIGRGGGDLRAPLDQAHIGGDPVKPRQFGQGRGGYGGQQARRRAGQLMRADHHDGDGQRNCDGSGGQIARRRSSRRVALRWLLGWGVVIVASSGCGGLRPRRRPPSLPPGAGQLSRGSARGGHRPFPERRAALAAALRGRPGRTCPLDQHGHDHPASELAAWPAGPR